MELAGAIVKFCEGEKKVPMNIHWNQCWCGASLDALKTETESVSPNVQHGHKKLLL